MSNVPPVVLLLDDADIFKAVEGTCLRRERCRLIKAAAESLRPVASAERPSLLILSSHDAASKRRVLELRREPPLSEIPAVLLDFAGRGRVTAAPAPVGGRAPLALVAARKGRSGTDFSEMDGRLDAAIKTLMPELDRRIDRVAVSVAARCRGAGMAGTLRTKDISTSGLFLKTRRPPAPGQRFDVRLSLGPRRSVSATCEVVRRVLHAGSKGADGDLIEGIGARFVDLRGEEREALRIFMLSASGQRPRRAAPRVPASH
ncbi:MAG TPA: PilZ domain-containing protein [Candidatus Polarisedimenticolia bacterium]|nr:PilZ domain-containing protein [Candidatus Polarisedimenticolia bacterium]